MVRSSALTSGSDLSASLKTCRALAAAAQTLANITNNIGFTRHHNQQLEHYLDNYTRTSWQGRR